MTPIEQELSELLKDAKYDKFRRSGLADRRYTSDDWKEFFESGKYLLIESKKIVNGDFRELETHWQKTVQGSLLLSIGSEYFLKAVLLKNGKDIMLDNVNVIKFSKLKESIISLESELNLEEFNNEQLNKTANHQAEIGERYAYMHMDSKSILEFMHFYRNSFAHKPFAMSAIRTGAISDCYRLLNYLSKKQFGALLWDEIP